MHFSRTTTAMALGFALAASPALAQDGSNRDSHFDGPYVSGFFGWGAQSNDNGETLRFDTNGDGRYNDTVNTAAGANAFTSFCHGEARTELASGGCASDADGIDYGGRIGFDRRMSGNFVVGGLLEFNKNESKDGTSAFSSSPASYGIVRQLDYAVSARARAGYTPGGGALFYVTGGGSYARIDHRFFTTNNVNAFDDRRDHKMVWGWQAGGGGEIMLTDQVSLGLEYLYNRYHDDKYRVAVSQGNAPAINPFILQSGQTNLRMQDRTFELHTLRATVSYQF